MQPLLVGLRFPISYKLFEYRIFLSKYFPDLSIKPRWIFIITNDSFIRKIVVKYIDSCFVKEMELFKNVNPFE